jgi:hypothetical protein
MLGDFFLRLNGCIEWIYSAQVCACNNVPNTRILIG